MTVKSASVMCQTKKDPECKENADQSTDGTQIPQKVYNLKEEVKKRALFSYKEHTNETAVDDIEYDWSGVKFIPTEPKVHHGSHNTKGKNDVFSKTVIDNKTDVDQHHTLRTERESSTYYTVFLRAGFTTEYDVNISVLLPVKIANASGGLSGEILLENEITTERSEKQKWFAENYVKVPKNSKITVSALVKENECECYFETWIGVVGSVTVTVQNKKLNKTYTYKIPTDTIIYEEFPLSMKKVQNGINYIKFVGTCRFRYAIEQEININNC